MQLKTPAESSRIADPPSTASIAQAITDLDSDPAQAASKLRVLLNDASPLPETVNEEMAARISARLSDDPVRILTFLAILKEHDAQATPSSALQALRLPIAAKAIDFLLHLPLDEATKTVDKKVSPAEKFQFAVEKTNSLINGTEDIQPWLPWLSEVGPPFDKTHPLALLAIFAAQESGEPRWIDALPPGKLKDATIAAYAEEKIPHGEEVAFEWMTRLPEGPVRRQIAAKLATYQQASQKDDLYTPDFIVPRSSPPEKDY